MHVDEAVLQRLVDREMAGVATGVRGHVDGCEACADRLSALREEDREIEAVLRALDHPVPAVSLQAVRARAATAGHRPRRAALAAVLAFLVLGGGAAAAMSSGTVGALVRRIWRPAPRAAAPAPRPAPAGAPAALGTGIAFAPGRRVVIDFLAAQATGSIEITTGPDSLVRIDPVGGRASYSVSSGGVTIDNRSTAASYVITLPAGLAEARVRVAGHTVAEQRNGRLSTTPGGTGRTRLVVPLDR